METYAIALLSRSSSKAASSASASAQPITGHITVTPPTHTHTRQTVTETDETWRLTSLDLSSFLGVRGDDSERFVTGTHKHTL